MSDDFFRFPQTPHLAWMGAGAPRDDKVLAPEQVQAFLSGDVVVEEKIDGANLGFSLDAQGRLRAQNRGQYLVEPYAGQFARLPAWLAVHGESLAQALAGGHLILFGEWCAARHSLAYDRLPDWFVAFDVYDRQAGAFWSTARRNALVEPLGLAHVPRVAQGRYTLQQLQDLLVRQPSRYRQGSMEGVVVRRESADWCESRAKLVRADFTQAIAEHWRRRAIQWNRVQPPGHGRHPNEP